MSKELLQIVFSGVVFGSIYALMSIGLSLIWGGLRVLNLTQGALFMLGAYTAFWAGKTLAWPPLLGLLAAFVAMGILGVVIYAGPLRLLLNRPDQQNATILVTIGLAIILENFALISFGPRSRRVPELVAGSFKLGGVVMTWNALVMALTAILLVAMLVALLKWTRLGMAIRALSQDRDGAQLSGIGVDRTFAVVMFIS